MLKDKKIMIAALANDASIIITKVDNKKAEFEIIGNIKNEVLFDMVAYLCDDAVGIIRKKDEKDSTILELWEENSVKSGDVLNIKKESCCKGDLLYGFNLTTEILCKFKDFLYSNLYDDVNDIYFTLSKTENEIKSEVISVLPDAIVFIYPAKATENFEISKGCGLVYKDGGAVTESSLRNFVLQMAQDSNISVQPYIGTQMPLAETFGIIGNGAKVIPVCIPVSHMGTRTEIVDIKDIEAAAKLTLKIIGE